MEGTETIHYHLIIIILNIFTWEKNNSFLEINIFKLDIRNPINLVIGRKFLLQKKDIIFIPPTEIVKWNRTISLLLPQTDLFKSYNPIINNGLRTYREP